MKQDRQIFLSVAASVAVHALLLLLAAFLIGLSGFFPPEQAQASISNEVILYLPEVVPVHESAREKGNPFLRTNEKNAVEETPMDAAFESDRNTLAATEAPPAMSPDGDKPLPTQEGKEDLPFMELDSREYVDGEDPSEDASKSAPAAVVAMATPTPLQPKEVSAVMPMEKSEQRESKPPPKMDLKENSFSDRLDPIPVRMPEELDMKREQEEPPEKEMPETPEERESKPEEKVAEQEPVMPEVATPPSKPAPEKDGFRPHTRQTAMSGTISNRGANSVSAAATPLGKYKAIVGRAIEKKWHRYRQDKAEFLVYGSIKLKFKVDRNGQPRNLKIIKNDANAIMADFTLSAILEADIPPMPVEILDILDNEELEVTYDVIIY